MSQRTIKWITVLTIIASLTLYRTLGDTYEFSEYNSSYIGKSFEVNRPMGYLSGLGVCNDIPEYVAKNSKCRFLSDTDYLLIELRPACIGCLDKERLIAPYRVHFKESLALKVVDSFIVENGEFEMRLFNPPIEMLVLEDHEGYRLEIMELMIEEFSIFLDEASREDQLLTLENERFIKSNNEMTARFCFTKGEASPKKLMTNAHSLIQDFKLMKSLDIQPRENCHIDRKYGFDLTVRNFDDYLTFRYYSEEWGIYGKWY
ncbi:hypothetical protein AB4342_05880 [Vibrio breoganii]